MFCQYTRQGESIEALEDTPAKRKIDELMGRVPTADALDACAERSEQTESKLVRTILNQEAVQKTSSVGSIRQPRNLGALRQGKHNILVSGAQSRDLTESIVSVAGP